MGTDGGRPSYPCCAVAVKTPGQPRLSSPLPLCVSASPRLCVATPLGTSLPWFTNDTAPSFPLFAPWRLCAFALRSAVQADAPDRSITSGADRAVLIRSRA